MKRNADNKQPPNFLQSPKLEERRPPATAAGEGSCPRPPPAPRPEPRNAGRRQREPEAPHSLRAAPAAPCPGRAPTAPLRPGDLPSLLSLPRQPPPAAPRQRVRLPDTGTPPPRHSGWSLAHFVLRQKPVRAFFSSFSPVRPALPAREAPVPSGAKSLFPRSKLRAQRRCPADRASLSKGERIIPRSIPNSAGARGWASRGAQTRSGVDAARVATRPGGPMLEPRGLRQRARRALPGKGWSRTRHTDTPSAAPPVLARQELPLKEILIFQPSRSWRKASKREPSIQRGAAPCQQPPAADAAALPRRARFHGALTPKPTEGG